MSTPNPSGLLSGQPAKGSIEGGRYRPLWAYDEEALQAFQVTPLSRFGDLVWRCTTMVPGQRDNLCTINWDMELFDGSRLGRPQNARRLDWARKVLALMLHAPSDGVSPAGSSMIDFRIGFKWLLSWMAHQGYHLPGELSPVVIEQYFADLPEFIAKNTEDDEITVATAIRALHIIRALWSERVALARWGIPSLIANPFSEIGAPTYAKGIATKAQGWIPPLPDEVAIPLFNKAAWFLGHPAEDVVTLVDQVVNDPLAGQETTVATPRSGSGNRRHTAGLKIQSRIRRADSFLSSYRFRTLPGDDAPWHPVLDATYALAYKIEPKVRLRQLFETVREACALIIQGTSGMRISELMGIEAGFDEVSGLPKGVRIETSPTELYEVFLIRTMLSKTEEGLPREVDWLLGLRPTGTSEEPLTVRALRLLNRLHDPFRAHAKTPRLILAGRVGATLSVKTSALGAMTSDRQRDGLKRFIARWVDLSNLPNESKHKIADNDLVPWRDSKGAIFKPHMLRKSWAQFVFAVHPEMMPAISMQFHHLSMAMSDTGYIGNNPLILQSMNEVRHQQQVALMFESVMGRRVLAGKMGEQIENHIGPLAEEVKNLPTSEAYRRVVRYCDETDLQLFFSPHGKCMPVARSSMRCQQEAGTSVVLRLGPNPATRQPSLCIGCDCFVLDEEHAPFWQERYIQNWIAYKRAERLGKSGSFTVIKSRAQSAGKLLKKLGISLEVLDRQVTRALQEQEHGLA